MVKMPAVLNLRAQPSVAQIGSCLSWAGIVNTQPELPQDCSNEYFALFDRWARVVLGIKVVILLIPVDSKLEHQIEDSFNSEVRNILGFRNRVMTLCKK